MPNFIKLVSVVNISFSWRIFITVLATILAVFQLYTAGTVPFIPVAQRGIHLALTLMMVFIIYDIRGSSGRNRLPWQDIPLVIFAGVVMLYAVFQANELIIPLRMANPTLIDMIFSIIAVILVLEGSRRVLGWELPIMTLILLAYAVVGHLLPRAVWHPGITIKDFASYMYMSTEGIFGSTLGASTNFVYIFILFGCLLQASGGAELFSDLAMGLVGKRRGGPAKIAVFSSALLGTISGSAVSNVATTGSVTIPMMKRAGYDSCFAGAVEATASTGGQIMPPVMGSAAFIMVEIIGVSYLTIVKTAIIPAFLYFLAVYVSVDLEAAKRGLEGLSRDQLPRFIHVMRQRCHMIIPFAVLLYLVVILRWEADSAAFWGIWAGIGASFLKSNTRLNWSALLCILNNAARATSTVAVICACAGIMFAVFEATALSARMANLLVAMSGGNLLVLLVLAMVATILLGMPLPTTPAYIVSAILIAPALVRLGLPPLTAHFFIFYYACMAPITPPIALAAYVAAGIAGADISRTGWIAWSITLPCFIIPFMFIYGPELLLASGTAGSTLIALISAVIGVIGMSAAIRGYFAADLRLIERSALFLGSFLLIHVSWITDLVGFVIVGLVFLLTTLKKKALLKTEL